ncbi:MAG: TatD family hydrolase [Candidatus Omnitrophica bacterium]|nr:TatD family hydrolase [Candidatus Omnitrophota bacterium]MCB9720773.1 TatD family hydrolase [Candidatus Omnitrophota bacterium]
MNTYDTHAHLDHLENLDQALSAADQAGVRAIVAVSMNLESCRRCLEIKRQAPRPPIYLGMGMHPSDANPADVDAIKDLAREYRADLAVIGEIGLDFWYKWVRKDQVKKQEQRTVYRALLELAVELDLPPVIHSRGVWRECFETARDVGLSRAEFHWYSGPIDVLKDILDAGYYISTSPSVAYSPQSREVIEYAPLDRILIETDSPVYYRNRDTGEEFQAEPKDVFRTLTAVSELKELDPQEAVRQFNQNAEDFFGIAVEDL